MNALRMFKPARALPIIYQLVKTAALQKNQFFKFSTEDRPVPLRSKKGKARDSQLEKFYEDSHVVETQGGNGGNGCVSFLQAWCNEKAGPDGGDGGSGGHVIFQASPDVTDLSRLESKIKADNGERGYTRDCTGKNAKHQIVKVPIGTIIRNPTGTVVADLSKNGMMFVAARGGAGGHGNHFFASPTLQAPQIAEFGGEGERCRYLLEVKTMAHIGLVGMPNAGKSTLLRAITRARPRVADYEFTTLRPQVGMIEYSDYEQIAVADLPGLIEGSHKNFGLGIQFLKHAERCRALLYVIDLSLEKPWVQLEKLHFELSMFSKKLASRPQAIVANKIDLPEAENNLKELESHVDLPVIPVSAKMGINLAEFLKYVRQLYDEHPEQKKEK